MEFSILLQMNPFVTGSKLVIDGGATVGRCDSGELHGKTTRQLSFAIQPIPYWPIRRNILPYMLSILVVNSLTADILYTQLKHKGVLEKG